ncbi:ABC transporter ATP-binding protein [Lacisediminimonas profundi]|uniref:ABC transporter ATP-binding protein n=1 Tax=Lacisediminimonas profundi TaxID=2603856 RepID=UPI00124B2F58|nr:ATP-binding cassette domain-containing protein [Lacisediminimonas profundi]
MEPTPLIRIRGLWTQFGDFVVHQDLDLDVWRGEILSLVGGSGSGKTTLLRQMLGLAQPARGSVQVAGEEIGPGERAAGAQMRSRWGMLFQHGALFSALSAFENVAQPLRELHALPPDLIRDATLQKLHMVGISPEQAQRMPADLSGGMVKRVALARALALEPELLFLDEPTAGLDPALSEAFVDLIASLHRAMHLTVVMVTHDLDTMAALSTRIAVLADKHVVATGSMQEIMRVDHSFIREFFLGERGLRALQGLEGVGAQQAPPQ